jgi:plasmid stabilization system protein ParE
VNLTFHPQAATDLAEAVAFYKKEVNARVAARFLDEFERVARLLTENPGFGTPFEPPRRVYPLRTFPYRPAADGLRILAVRHHSRHPNHGQERH